MAFLVRTRVPAVEEYQRQHYHRASEQQRRCAFVAQGEDDRRDEEGCCDYSMGKQVELDWRSTGLLRGSETDEGQGQAEGPRYESLTSQLPPTSIAPGRNRPSAAPEHGALTRSSSKGMDRVIRREGLRAKSRLREPFT